jgi:peptidoglycan/xylan/chitin deacetylase (PgdA/CDA1 family)
LGIACGRRLLLSAIFILASSPAVARHATIALTFDDLPALTVLNSQPYVTYTNIMLLRGLRRHHLPAIGFVNEGKLDDLDRSKQIKILRMWLKAGMLLGNHTYSHETPNTLSPEAYIEDIANGEKVIRPLMERRGLRLRWFRHPYLETGSPQAVRQQIDDWLSAHGYRIAPVTMQTSDWLFAEPYDDALARHDSERAGRIRQSYLAYSGKMIAWHREAAQQLFGRDIRYVMLLHDSRLNADCIDDLAALLKRAGLRGVTLDKAMRDTVYKIPDHYAGRNGIDWLERWGLDLHKSLPWADFVNPPAEIQSEYARVDNDNQQ